MPTLLDVQHAVHRSVVEGDELAACTHIVSDGLPAKTRLQVYRNTFFGTLTKALRLSYPAVNHLVGDAFFESAAHTFIRDHPPTSAYLDEYGASFPGFLADFEPAAGIPYLPDVARLDWAASRALHAPDTDPLDPSRLATINLSDHARVVLTPDPTVGLLHSNYPVDDIWQAVLARDDTAMSAIDIASGPVWLLVRRAVTGVDIRRLRESEWRFTASLYAGQPLAAALDAESDIDAIALLAEHLAQGLFVNFEIKGQNTSSHDRRLA